MEKFGNIVKLTLIQVSLLNKIHHLKKIIFVCGQTIKSGVAIPQISQKSCLYLHEHIINFIRIILPN